MTSPEVPDQDPEVLAKRLAALRATIAERQGSLRERLAELRKQANSGRRTLRVDADAFARWASYLQEGSPAAIDFAKVEAAAQMERVAAAQEFLTSAFPAMARKLEQSHLALGVAVTAAITAAQRRVEATSARQQALAAKLDRFLEAAGRVGTSGNPFADSAPRARRELAPHDSFWGRWLGGSRRRGQGGQPGTGVAGRAEGDAP
ncbi:MAG: hypothetical protein IPK26_20380 [Planctomycetes bacterium]|nr:hypothetical protein [Planctomycetota bacterium]